MNNVGAGDRPNILAHPSNEFGTKFLVLLGADHQSHIGIDALALDVMRIANDGGLRDLFMRDERTLHFRRPEPVTGDIDDIIDPASDPVIAVRVPAAAVAGEIFAGIGGRRSLREALVVSIKSPELAGA